MNVFSAFTGLLLRGLLKFTLLLVAGAIVLGLLSIALAWVIVSAMGALLTGRKPAVFVTAAHLHQASQRFRNGVWARTGTRAPASPADVVDVQAHEVQDVAGAVERIPMAK